jgi:glycosyltransferase involved in cell wall biosynthesis
MAHAGPAIPMTFISSHALHGGSERQLELLLEALGRDWVCGVVCLKDGPLVSRLRARGHSVDVLPTPARVGMLRTSGRLRRRLVEQRPAVIHANGVKAALMAVLAARGERWPIIWVKHDFSWDGPLARLIALRCAEVVGVSAAVIATFRGRAARRVRVVPNGIPEPRVGRASGRARLLGLLGRPDDTTRAVVVGRLEPCKGQLEMVEVAALLRPRREVHVALIGGETPHSPDHARELRFRVSALGLEDRVTLLGHQEGALELIAGADLLALPTMPDQRGMGREGFGLTGVEALAVGTPVVGYADGALPEVLGRCAALVPPGDRDALCEAIVTLLDDARARERLVRCGRARMAERYRLPTMVAAMTERYRAVAAGALSRPGAGGGRFRRRAASARGPVCARRLRGGA